MDSFSETSVDIRHAPVTVLREEPVHLIGPVPSRTEIATRLMCVLMADPAHHTMKSVHIAGRVVGLTDALLSALSDE